MIGARERAADHRNETPTIALKCRGTNIGVRRVTYRTVRAMAGERVVWYVRETV